MDRDERLMSVLDEVKDDLAKRLGADGVQSLGVSACDHSHRRTADVLHGRIPPAEIPHALHQFEQLGGYCDCEVLLNALPTLLAQENEDPS